MDQQGTDRHRILEQLKNKLSSGCVDFDRLDYEELAVCNEEALEQVLDEGIVDDKLIGNMISQREVFPVIFGSALRLDGVDRLLDIMNKYCEVSENGDDKQSDMSARVYKISRDDRGERLTHIKVTGGSLKAKQLINGEKINQIRIYSGEKYTSVNEAGGNLVTTFWQCPSSISLSIICSIKFFETVSLSISKFLLNSSCLINPY